MSLNRGSDKPSVHRIFAEKARTIACSGDLSLPELGRESTIAEDRLLTIFEGNAPDITLREIAGISLALGVSLDRLLA